jgi:hypothetical protein
VIQSSTRGTDLVSEASSLPHSRDILVKNKTERIICRLTVEEQEKVIMEEYELGWADRAESVQLNKGKMS